MPCACLSVSNPSFLSASSTVGFLTESQNSVEHGVLLYGKHFCLQSGYFRILTPHDPAETIFWSLGDPV
jgi:hypothetical protein